MSKHETDAELEAVFPIREREAMYGTHAVFLVGCAPEDIQLGGWCRPHQAKEIQSICMVAYRVGWNARAEEFFDVDGPPPNDSPSLA